jgi:hypothetical protein
VSNSSHRDRRIRREAAKAMHDTALLAQFIAIARAPVAGPRSAAQEAREIVLRVAAVRRKRCRTHRRNNSNISHRRDPRQRQLEWSADAT